MKSCLLFAAMPAFYYLFDYIMTIFTDFMYSRTRVAMQFMPFITASFYFVFVLLYYKETQKQVIIQRERDMLDTQLKQAQILFEINAKVPENLTISDTELCSLLSNSLENAINACVKVTDSNNRYIKLRVYCKNNKLCIDIRNSYQTAPIFHQGFPVAESKGHGFGTKSMAIS